MIAHAMSVEPAKSLVKVTTAESLPDSGKEETQFSVIAYKDQSKFHGRFGWFWRISYAIDSIGEFRGIDRYPEDERGNGGWRQLFQLGTIWIGACGSLPSMAGFFLGPLLFELSFKDSMSAGISGCFFGCLFAAFGSILGPASGLRQMTSARFQFGWWFAKFIALLNILTLLGWAVISLVFGGQILAALNSHIPLEVGIIIVTVLTIVVTVFGIRYVVWFDKVFVGPGLIAFLLVYVCAGDQFAVNSVSTGDPETIRGNWISFFSTTCGVTSAWIGLASDYYVTLPPRTNPAKLFVYTLLILFLPSIFIGCAGIGLGSAAAYNNPKWLDRYNELGNGGLLEVSMSKWGGGGKFLVVIMFISLVTNNIMGTYSIPLSFQSFGRVWAKVPRYILSIVTAIIYFILASVGREKLSEILSNFLPMIAYWSIIYGTIVFLETMVFRRGRLNSYQWALWNDKDHFPIMYAAIFSFGAGVAAVVVGMNQAYYSGVLARRVGSKGGDLAIYLSAAFPLVAYLPSRAIEIALRKERPPRP